MTDGSPPAPPAECVVDMLADQDAQAAGVEVPREAADVAATYLRPGSGIPWSAPPGFRVGFAGEGEWRITLDLFRDLGIAFGAEPGEEPDHWDVPEQIPGDERPAVACCAKTV